MQTKDTTILVCCHKKDYFCNNEGFLPIQVGKALHPELDLGIIGDNTGDNISDLNPNFCELTAHYWYWKNGVITKYIGLNHYRRYFDFSRKAPFGTSYYNVSEDTIIKEEPTLPNLNKIFENYDIILPIPIIYPYSLYTDYCAAHISNDARMLEQVVHELYPEYDSSYKKVMYNNNKLSHYNMFITKDKIFEDYSKWLFDILFEVKKRIFISQYADQARVFGYMSERLLNVYVKHNNLKVKYLPIVKVIDIPNFTLIQNFAIAVKHSITAYFLTKHHPLIGEIIHHKLNKL